VSCASPHRGAISKRKKRKRAGFIGMPVIGSGSSLRLEKHCFSDRKDRKIPGCGGSLFLRKDNRKQCR
jgi:hypothetical protein